MNKAELIKKVQSTIMEHTIFTRYNIPLNESELVVLGYSHNDENGIGSKQYICIGEFIEGELGSGVYLRNSVVLSHIKYDFPNQEITPHIDDEKDTIDDECVWGDAFEFWRLPTDDEIKLYKLMVHTNNYYLKEFEKLVWKYSNEESVYLDDVMTLLDEFVSLNKMKNVENE